MVTGGTRGIGYAIVKKYLEAGASVVLFGSREATAKAALDKIRSEMLEAIIRAESRRYSSSFSRTSLVSKSRRASSKVSCWTKTRSKSSPSSRPSQKRALSSFRFSRRRPARLSEFSSRRTTRKAGSPRSESLFRSVVPAFPSVRRFGKNNPKKSVRGDNPLNVRNSADANHSRK